MSVAVPQSGSRCQSTGNFGLRWGRHL